MTKKEKLKEISVTLDCQGDIFYQISPGKYMKEMKQKQKQEQQLSGENIF